MAEQVTSPPWMTVRVVDGVGGIAPGDWKRLRVGAGPVGVSWTLVHHDAAVANTGLARIEAVTPADVQRVVQTYLIEGKPLVVNYYDESTKKSEGGAR